MSTTSRPSARLRPRLTIGLLAASLTAAFLVAPPAAADAAQQTAIVSLNVNVDQINEPFVSTRPSTRTATVTVASLTGGIDVQWTDRGQLNTVALVGSSSSPLHRGVYTAVSAPSGSKIGLEFGLGDVDFDADHGVVQVLDIAADASGALTRFDVVFTSSDLTAADASFGEIRMNEPETVAGVSPSMNAMAWPRMSLHQHAVRGTETFANVGDASISIGAAAVATGNAGDYTVDADTCSGRTLAPAEECSLDVSFSPLKAGPSVSELQLATSAGTARIPLSGRTSIGTSQLTSSGKDPIDADYGGSLTYPGLIAVGSSGTVSSKSPAAHRFSFITDVETPAAMALAAKGDTRTYGSLTLFGPSSKLAVGTYTVPATKPTYWLDYVSNDEECTYSSNERFVVHALQVDAQGQPDYARIDFSFTCRETGRTTGTLTGHLIFGARSDITAPKAPTSLAVSGHTVTWKKSSSSDVARTIVRLQPAAGGTPETGFSAYAGTGSSASLPALVAGRTYVVTAYSVDATGNVSAAATKTITY